MVGDAINCFICFSCISLLLDCIQLLVLLFKVAEDE